MATDDDDLLDCFVNLPASDGIPFVLQYENIRDSQLEDARLQVLRDTKPDSIVNQMIAPGIHLACYIPAPNAPWKIYLPTNLLDPAVRWYHLALGHLGQRRIYDTMSQHLYHPDLLTTIETIISRCDACQREKNVLRGHGERRLQEK